MGTKNAAENRLDDAEVAEIIGTIGDIFDEEEHEELDRGDDLGELAGDDDDLDTEEELDDEPADEEPAEDESTETEEPAAEEEESADEKPAAEEEEPSEEEEESAKKGSDDNGFIPRSRLNKEIKKRRELEDRIRQLQEQGAQAPAAASQPAKEPVKIDREQLKRHVEAILDGEPDNAADALAQVLESLSGANAQVSPDEISRLVDRKFEQDQLSRRVSEVVSEFTFLDDSNDDTFDSDAAQDVLDLKTMYEGRGMRPIEALDSAVAKVAAQYGYGQQKEVTAPEEKKPAKLKPANIEKKIEMAKKTPGRVPQPTTPQGRDKVSIATLSDEDFDKLSVEARRRARGDFA